MSQVPPTKQEGRLQKENRPLLQNAKHFHHHKKSSANAHPQRAPPTF